MPDAIQKALWDRVRKLLSYRDRNTLTDSTRREHSGAIMHVRRLETRPALKKYSKARHHAIDDARQLRERYYEGLNINIMNHTTVSYGYYLARQACADEACIHVRFAGLISKCKDADGKANYRNPTQNPLIDR